MHIIQLHQPQQMQAYRQQVWQLLAESYARVTGGLNYTCAEELISTSARWKLALHGGRVVAVTIYKAKKGLKLVAMAACRQARDWGRRALINIIRQDLRHCWMELSEQAEHFVLKYCGGHRFIIHNSLVPHLLDKPVTPFEQDGFHYCRTIQGQSKLKIAVGTPCL